MSFGSNLAFVRKMHNAMTQEELAEQLQVSRQTISKWEMDAAFPEMEKAIALSNLFNCSLDELMKEDMNCESESFQKIRLEKVNSFRYVPYAVVSEKPEEDAMRHITLWAKEQRIEQPCLIGWDFPYVSQEQNGIFHMRGYCAACILPEGVLTECKDVKVQPAVSYVAITIENPFENPFVLIPNAYKTLLRYIEVNCLKRGLSKDVLECYEREYARDEKTYMDIYIAVEG